MNTASTHEVPSVGLVHTLASLALALEEISAVLTERVSAAAMSSNEVVR